MSAPESTSEATTDLQFTESELTELAVATYTEAVDAGEVAASPEATDLETEPVSNVFTGLPPELIEALASRASPRRRRPGGGDPRRHGRPRRAGRAQTGSGKTLAFGSPSWRSWPASKSRPCHPRAA